MDARESLREAESLRFRIQMNNRLRLECLAAVSKVFREYDEPIADELLSSVVFALPQELVSINGRAVAPVSRLAADEADSQKPNKPAPPPQPGNPPDKPKPENPPNPPKPENPPNPPKPENPPNPPKPENPPNPPKPGNPPDKPKPEQPPGNPPFDPARPALPPEDPDTEPLQAPAVPPEGPDQSAMGYLA